MDFKPREGYPFKLSESDVMEEVKKLQGLVVNQPSHVSTPARISLIDIGLTYLQQRVIKHVKDNTENQLKISEQQAKSSSRLALIAIIISAAAFVATLIFSFLGYYEDKNWQNAQLKELNSIQRTLENSRQ